MNLLILDQLNIKPFVDDLGKELRDKNMLIEIFFRFFNRPLLVGQFLLDRA